MFIEYKNNMINLSKVAHLHYNKCSSKYRVVFDFGYDSGYAGGENSCEMNTAREWYFDTEEEAEKMYKSITSLLIEKGQLIQL